MVWSQQKNYTSSPNELDQLKTDLTSALNFLLNHEEYRPGRFGEKVKKLYIQGCHLTWVDPWFLLGAFCDQEQLTKKQQKLLIKRVKKYCKEYFTCAKAEKEMQKCEPVAYQFKMYEFICFAILDSKHGHNFLSQESQALIEPILDEIAQQTFILDHKQAA